MVCIDVLVINQTHNALLSPHAQYGYIPGLNGIRAISVLIVLLAHMGMEHIIPGGFGVTVFFFISGFLITRLLIAENETKGRIGLKQFYLRRFIRLYPALLFMVVGTTFAYIVLGWGVPKPLEMLSALFYGANLYQVGIRIVGDLPFMPWTHLWSLAVEEHFYLIFPAFLIMLSGNWRRILKVLICLLAAALFWRTYIYVQTQLPIQDYSYMMTDTRIDSLIWGCVLSVMLHVYGSSKKISWLIGLWPVIASFLAIMASFFIKDEAFRYTSRFSLQGLALFILFSNLFFWDKVRWVMSILEWKPLAWLGTVSYGLYLWHVPIIDMCIRFIGDNPKAYLMAVPLSIYLAAFSYYFIEKRFLDLRKAHGSHGTEKTPVKIKTNAAIARVLAAYP